MRNAYSASFVQTTSDHSGTCPPMREGSNSNNIFVSSSDQNQRASTVMYNPNSDVIAGLNTGGNVNNINASVNASNNQSYDYHNSSNYSNRNMNTAVTATGMATNGGNAGNSVLMTNGSSAMYTTMVNNHRNSDNNAPMSMIVHQNPKTVVIGPGMAPSSYGRVQPLMIRPNNGTSTSPRPVFARNTSHSSNSVAIPQTALLNRNSSGSSIQRFPSNFVGGSQQRQQQKVQDHSIELRYKLIDDSGNICLYRQYIKSDGTILNCIKEVIGKSMVMSAPSKSFSGINDAISQGQQQLQPQQGKLCTQSTLQPGQRSAISSCNDNQQQQSQAINKSPSTFARKWACDYCNMDSFSTYEEAIKHEEVCSMNQTKRKQAIEESIVAYSSEEDQKRSSQNSKQIIRSLAISEDKNWLSETLVLIRSCIEVFSATQEDVANRSRKGGMSAPVKVGRVGIRCKYCAHLPPKLCHKGAVSYPAEIRIINQSVRNWQRYHFLPCKYIPPSVRQKYISLKSVRSHSGNSSIIYWTNSAKAIGLVDTKNGIYFGNEPRSLDDIIGGANLQTDGILVSESVGRCTDFLFTLLSQQQFFIAAGKDHVKPNESVGFECIHCVSANNDGYRFFPKSCEELREINSPHGTFYSHLMFCIKFPQEIKNSLLKALSSHIVQKSELPFGWEGELFDKLWQRLLEKRNKASDGNNHISSR